MANTKRRCRYCKSYGKPEDGVMINNAYFCSIDEATKYAYENKAKGSKKVKAEKKKINAEKKRSFYANDIKTRKESAQKAFNAYIRERDKDQPCISCGTTKDVQYCAGHHYTRGARPDLAFHEDNCHKQCNQYCNMNLSGNLVPYRENLIKKIGLERYEALTLNKTVKRTAQDYLEIENKFKGLLKSLH
ncbi:MAG: recombination protein NinG [Emcibacteraceae bacterium]|nr:recombination protein NinG [Emcibacteraceae bacterium]